MNRAMWLSVFGVLAVGCAPSSPEALSESELSHYRAGVRSGCIQQGGVQGPGLEKVRTMCDCLVRGLDRKLGEPGWRRMAFLHRRGERERVERMLREHAADLRQCAL